MEVYFPDTFVDQADLEVADGVPAGKYTSGLGQLRLGFAPSDAEDAVSMALTAAARRDGRRRRRLRECVSRVFLLLLDFVLGWKKERASERERERKRL